MSFNQADLQTISTVFEKTVEEISGAISSEQEVSLDLRLNGKVYTTQQIEEATKANKDAYVEVGYKNVAKEAGIELLPGDKDAKLIAEKIKTGITILLEEKYKNLTPPEELTAALQKTVESENKYKQLFETHEGIKGELQTSQQDYTDLEGKIKVRDRNNKIRAAFPDKMKFDKEDGLLIITNTLSFEELEDGTEQIKENGALMMNSVGGAETLENVVKTFSEKKGWMGKKAVDGKDRNPNGEPRGLSDDKAIAYMAEKGVEPMSTEGSKMFNELTSAATE